MRANYNFIGALAFALLAGCGASRSTADPVIEFTKLPSFGEGSSDRTEAIEGRVTGGQKGQKVVIYARSGPWWIQPFSNAPFTTIEADSQWKNKTHPGSAYAALLVEEGYRPSQRTDILPEKGGSVLAVTAVQGGGVIRKPGKVLLFGGYEWSIRQTQSNPGGTNNDYDPANAWTDERGFLHMRIAGVPGHWTSSEVKLTRSLGYGNYRFVVRDVSQLEPSMVFTMLTWDDDGPSREMDIEISRWGESIGPKNGQFVIQPYHVPANTLRFAAPAGRATFLLRWAPGRASFKAFRGAVTRSDAAAAGEHVFTSGVPSPGNESIHMNFYVFASNNPVKHGGEVIVEQFEYLP